MSYRIMYGKQFIKTSRGIIPLALFGDNNVTEYNHGKERRSRDWGIFGNGIEYSPEAYIDEMQSWCDGAVQEHFKIGGKWINDKGLIRWAKNGINGAKPIEQLRGEGLLCYLAVYIKEEYRKNAWEWSERELDAVCNTTEQLEQWIDAAKKRKENLTDRDECIYIHIGFLGNEPLKLPQNDITGAVIAKRKNQYITAVIGTNSVSLSPDIHEAKVFDNLEQARTEIPKCVLTHTKFIKAANKDKIKPYCIKVNNGWYLSKKTARRIIGTYNKQRALRFETEKVAQSYINKLVSYADAEFAIETA